MNSLVSICIPAWERPELLAVAVESCLAQSYADIEIVISDDSRTDRVARAVEPFLGDSRVRYCRNEARLNQSGNVNRLFDLARGDRLVLLHDDDILLPEAVEIMDRCWRANPGLAACYGKHYVTTHSGTILPEQSQDGNDGCFRVTRCAGLQAESMWAVLVSQFPPDGFMILTEAARATRFRSEALVGHACDFDFRLRLAQTGARFFFVDQYVSKYRATDTSISTGAVGLDFAFLIARDLELASRLEDVRLRFLRFRAPLAVRGFLAVGDRTAAWQLLWDDRYWPDGRLSGRRLTHLLLFIIPNSIVRAYGSTKRATRARLCRHDGIYRYVTGLRARIFAPAWRKPPDASRSQGSEPSSVRPWGSGR